MELCVGLDTLGLGPGEWGKLNIAWRPACGNDELTDKLCVTCPVPPPPYVPEPASLVVWSLLVVMGAVLLRRRWAAPQHA
jgi:hypothetical protein